ncbi:hypothetical protein LNV09_16305 [Paucibacter sp. B2R-40]|uniref:hypothetical protein n=1 Tax=Paucibacter sp. B2R-40 TaxID=2893554 RepID=UPI0021E3F77A|nr:hypothetical protein [Paucibacter sp. B2R-40]MCV2355708.1 hypothetical protein [Paucibacter sp. B2R-40]
MSSSGKGDANSYWPGFVDALTNVVIAMIFVVVVLAISLSFAAQLMGKKLAEKYIKEHATETVKPPPGSPEQAPLSAQQKPVDTQHITVAGNESAAKGATAKISQRQATALQLDYAAGALTLDPAALDLLKSALAVVPDAATKRVQLSASGPDMALTENQRAAFLRAMAVRNVLLDAGFTPAHISMSVDTARVTTVTAVNLSFSDSP